MNNTDKTFAEKTNKYSQQINAYLREYAKEVTSTNTNINIIDLYGPTYYHIPDEYYIKLFQILTESYKSLVNKIHKNNIITSSSPHINESSSIKSGLRYAEFQGNISGISIDIEITYERNNKLDVFTTIVTEDMFKEVLAKVAHVINDTLEDTEYAEQRASFKILVARRICIPTMILDIYKDIYRVTFPTLRVQRPFKELLINTIKNKKLIDKAFGTLLKSKIFLTAKLLDNMPMCPIPLLGCDSGDGGEPFFHAYSYNYNLGEVIPKIDDTVGDLETIISRYSIMMNRTDNLIYAPNKEVIVTINDDPILVKKIELSKNIIEEDKKLIHNDILYLFDIVKLIIHLTLPEHRKSVGANLISILARSDYNYMMIGEYVYLDTQTSIETGSQMSIETGAQMSIKTGSQMSIETGAQQSSLDTSNNDISNKNNNVIIDIYNYSKEYLKIWDAEVYSRGPLKAKLVNMAKLMDMDNYVYIRNNIIKNKIIDFVHAYDGIIRDGMIGILVYILVYDNYTVDISSNSKSKSIDYCFYEFIGQPSRGIKQGEIYKYRKEIEPDGIYTLIQNILPSLFKEVEQILTDYCIGLTDEKMQKSFSSTLKKFNGSSTNLYSHGFIKSSVSSIVYRLRTRGFAESLDTDGNIIGVGNGVLRLQPLPLTLITGYHEYAISKYTSLEWEPIDFENYYTKIMMSAIKDVIIEEDALEKIMCYFASSLDGNLKNPILLILYGGGGNGKSFLLEFVRLCMGQYAIKSPLSILTQEHESSQQANSALMSFKNARFSFYSEPNRSEELRGGNLKKMLNQEANSGREMYGMQENFEIIANQVLATNELLTIYNTDHGFWRRINFYNCKTKFTQRPDPNNPFEKKINRNFIHKFKHDINYKKAFFSILCYYYNVFHTKYQGDLDNIISPTIDSETEQYRNDQDSINQFICLYIQEDSTVTEYVSVEEMANRYIEYMAMQYKTNNKLTTTQEIVKQFENSKLGNKLTRLPGGIRNMILKGHKLLTHDERRKKVHNMSL